MNNFEQMHLFFFITTLSVVIITILLSVLLYFAIRLIRDLERTLAQTKQKMSELKEDIEDAKDEFLQSPVVQLVTSLAPKTRRKKYAKENE